MKKILTIIFCLYSCNAMTHPISWAHPQLEVRLSANGNGLFATNSIAKNTLLAVFGGTIINKKDVLSLDESSCRRVLQIEDNLWIGTKLPTAEPADLINHSCSPNAGIQGQICLVAMRDINANEEITFDYATVLTQWIGMDAIMCNCESPECRTVISADDWKSPVLQKKYAGYFSTYIQKKID